MILDKELQTFQQQLPVLLKEHAGEFVLIHGEDIAGFFRTVDVGYEAGCERFHLDSFLVKQVLEKEPEQALFHDLGPQCPS